jgi:hypothetical protein
MKRSFLTAVAMAAIALPWPAKATDPFEQKLTPDQSICQALNRLTFGPRPGDIDQVRRIGLLKWIDQQLHPERIVENPVLEERLKPLGSIRMPIDQVIANYRPNQNMGMMSAMEQPFLVLNRLPQAVRRKVNNGTAEERTAALDAMEPEMRTKVLAALSPSILEFTPKYREEAEKARKAANDVSSII